MDMDTHAIARVLLVEVGVEDANLGDSLDGQTDSAEARRTASGLRPSYTQKALRPSSLTYEWSHVTLASVFRSTSSCRLFAPLRGNPAGRSRSIT